MANIKEVIRTLAPDGKEILSNILDQYTGEQLTFKEIDYIPTIVDGIIYITDGTKYYRRDFIKLDVRWFGAKSNSISSGLINREAIQNAIKAAKTYGISSVIIPGGEYTLNVAKPIIIPSNIMIEGIPRCTIIKPDVSTASPTTDRPYPLTKDAVFATGDLETGIQFNINEGSVGTGENIYFYGIDIYCDYERGTFPDENQLKGINVTYTDNVQIENCKVENMPHTGIYVLASRNFKIINNYCIGNGFGNEIPRTRNGIASAGSASTSPLFPCYNGIISGNQCNFNYQEGIQYAAIRGVVINANNCLGNGHLGIEGDNGYDTTQTEEISGIEVASQAIISNNYVDGRKEDNTFAQGGISFAGGNEGTVIISNNMIRNIVGTSAISATQNNKGILTIEDNTIYNCDPSDPRHIISIKAEKATIQNNKVYKSGTTFSNFLYIQGASEQITVKNNYCEKTFGGFIRSFTTAINPKWDISGNTWLGGGKESVRITCQVDSNWDYLSIKDNKFYDCYTEMKLEVASTRTIIVKKLIISNNDITYIYNPPYAFSFVNVENNSILKAIVKNNDFGDVIVRSGIFNDNNKIVKLYQNLNILKDFQQSNRSNSLTLTGARSLNSDDFGDSGELIIYANVTAANLTITCPTASSMIGLTLIVIKTDSSANTVTVKGKESELINSSNTDILSTQFQSGTYKSNGIQLYKL